MPAPATIEAFLELGFKSGLLEQPDVVAYRQQLPDSGPVPRTAEELARAMVRDGLLTPFQADSLLVGKWRGFIINGKYRLMQKLGAGGMGSVYLCEHIHMQRRVALKVLPLAQARDPDSLERFYREARAVAQLDHPNIVRAHDIDREDDLHFIVLEYIDGSNLHDIVRRCGPLAVVRAAHYIRQAAQGLQHAFEAGLVHRDVKPGNILLDRNGVVKVLDMGLARFFYEPEDNYSEDQEGNVLGTADYVAPEQAHDSRVDVRADIYSLGVTFYYLLSGKGPFHSGTLSQKLIWHQVRQPKSIRAFRPEVPEELVQTLEKMMAKDPAERFQTPGEVVEALLPWTQTPIPPPPEAEMPPAGQAPRVGPSNGGASANTPLSQGVGPATPISRAPKIVALPRPPGPITPSRLTPARQTPPAAPESAPSTSHMPASLKPAEEPPAAKSDSQPAAPPSVRGDSKPAPKSGPAKPSSGQSAPAKVSPPNASTPKPLAPGAVKGTTPVRAPAKSAPAPVSKNPQAGSPRPAEPGFFTQNIWLIVGGVLFVAGIATLITAMIVGP
jgi:serine/threonine protein kinase